MPPKPGDATERRRWSGSGVASEHDELWLPVVGGAKKLLVRVPLDDIELEIRPVVLEPRPGLLAQPPGSIEEQLPQGFEDRRRLRGKPRRVGDRHYPERRGFGRNRRLKPHH